MAMQPGKRLLWLVFGSGLAALATILYHSIQLAFFVVWLILYFFIFRGQGWARWLVVLILVAIGLPLTELASEGFLFLLSVLHVFRLDVLRFLLAGVVFLVDAGILTFSESVGDFFAERRGILTISDWSQTALASPPEQNIRSSQPDELLDSSQIRTRVSRRIQWVTLVALALGWIIFLAGAGLGLYYTLALYRWLLTQVQAGAFILLDYVWIGLLSSFLALVIPVAGYFLLFVLPFLFTLPFVLPFARRWRGPAKFLVLRPFNRDRITTFLARFLRDHVAPFGHCYTLSDQKIRVPLSIRIPFLMGQLSLFNFRLRKIRRPHHVDKLVLAMRKDVRRNLNWCFSRTKLFPITCCDAGWRACVSRLVKEVDVVVVDLSSITRNVAWELQLLQDTGALAKTVFIVQESHSTEAEEGVSQVLRGSQVKPLIPYGPGVDSSTSLTSTRITEVLCGGRLGTGRSTEVKHED